MFFLLRMAFWLGLVLVLLPTGKTPESDKGPKVDPVEAVSAAGAAAADMAQFCNRQPQACEVGGQIAGVVGARVQSGARKAYEFLTDRIEGQDKDKQDKSRDKTEPKADKGADKAAEKPAEKTATDAEPSKKPAAKRVLDRKTPDHTGSIGDDTGTSDEPAPHDTLTQDDLDIVWQAPM